jgi:hypothetical protein
VIPLANNGEWWRRIPVDAIAFVVITFGMMLTHMPLIDRGMSWCDPSWMFHFGNRALHGEVPYRDFVFQVGPEPVYLDALFQKMFGETYLASMYAALFVKILRVWVYWLLVRRLVDKRAAALFCIYAAFDQSATAWPHHWSTPDAQLLFTTSALCFLAASRAQAAARAERVVIAYLVAAGAFAGAVLAARQATFTMITLVLVPATVVMVLRKELTVRRFLAMWVGYGVAVFVLVAILALQGALGPAIQQLFLDAPQKKNVSGFTALLDAVSGGALVATGPRWGRSVWGGFLFFIGIPTLLAGLSVYAIGSGRTVSLRTIGALVLPVAIVLGLFQRFGMLFYTSDLPRCFFTAAVAIAVLWPDRMRRWFGIEPSVAVAFALLPLASDWALEMSLPGRGWGDPHSLTPAAVLFALASVRLSNGIKLALCGALALAGTINFIATIRTDYSPLHSGLYNDGTLSQNSLEVDNAVTRGMRLAPFRAKLVSWLTENVRPGSTCFVYGVIPVVYEIVRCKNPTLIDVTIPDFISYEDAARAVAALKANPPDYLIAQENSWMNPPITIDYSGQPFPSELNPRASQAIHDGLHELLPLYEEIGFSREVLGPELVKTAEQFWDSPQATRLYRRKR